MSNGAVEDLTLEASDSKHFLIHRKDGAGSSYGLTATYSGVQDGAGMHGNVSWLWNGKATHGAWQGSIENSGGYSAEDKAAVLGVLTFGAAMVAGAMEESDENQRRASACLDNGHRWNDAERKCLQ